MKSIIRSTYFALGIILLFSCGPNKENEALKAEIESIRKENQAYVSKTNELANSLESYKKLLNEINDNLSAIDANALMTGNLKNELKDDASVGEQILNRIKNMHALMENSKLKVQSLDRALNDLRKKFGQQSEEVLKLNQELDSVANQLINREREFMQMKEGFEGEIADLESAYETQLRIAEDLKEMLNRAFYYVGTKDELQAKGITENEGGFIGIGRVKVLNANSPEAMFTQITKAQTDSLFFKKKSLILITDHPNASYKIKESKDRVGLIIKDKKLFWKQSNYLVIQTAN